MIFRLISLFQYLTIILLYFREYFLLFSKNYFTQILYYSSISSFIIMNALSFFIIGKKEKLKWIIYLLVSNIVFLIFVRATKELNIEIFKIDIGRILLLLLFFNFSRGAIPSSKSLMRLNIRLNEILALMLSIFTFLGSSYDLSGLSFNYGNPNGAGLAVLITIINLKLGLSFITSDLERILIKLLLLFQMFVIFITGSRSSIVSVILFFILISVFKYYHKIGKDSYYKRIASFIFIISFLFPYIWAMLFNIDYLNRINIMGKSIFTGREEIWNYMINFMFYHPLIARLTETVKFGKGPHNVLLAFWWRYGFISMILIWYIFFRLFSIIFNLEKNYFNQILIAMLLVSLVSMSFEELLFSDGFNYSYRLFSLMLFINFDGFKDRIQMEKNYD